MFVSLFSVREKTYKKEIPGEIKSLSLKAPPRSLPYPSPCSTGPQILICHCHCCEAQQALQHGASTHQNTITRESSDDPVNRIPRLLKTWECAASSIIQDSRSREFVPKGWTKFAIFLCYSTRHNSKLTLVTWHNCFHFVQLFGISLIYLTVYSSFKHMQLGIYWGVLWRSDDQQRFMPEAIFTIIIASMLWPFIIQLTLI